jgi:hypothetical protein
VRFGGWPLSNQRGREGLSATLPGSPVGTSDRVSAKPGCSSSAIKHWFPSPCCGLAGATKRRAT